MKFSYFLLLAAFVSAVTAASAQETAFPTALKVVRVDTANHRLFVAPSSSFLVTTESTRAYIEALTGAVSERFPECGVEWKVSFFAHPALATYKTDDQVREAVKDGGWADSYLAEYTNSDGRLERHPADPRLKKWIVIRPPPGGEQPN